MREMLLPIMPYAPWTVIGLVLWAIVYHLLPFVVCRFDSRLASAFQKRQPRTRLQLAQPVAITLGGIPESEAFDRWLSRTTISCHLSPGPVWTSNPAGVAGNDPPRSDSSVFPVWLSDRHLVNGWVTHRIRQRRQSFQLSLYKIYRFLDLQLTAGVNAFDVLKGLPEAIHQPLILQDFQRFSARLELTQDLDRALDELQAAFAGPDMNLLASQLRNSLQTGVMGQTFQRMESLLFNRHLSLVRARSKQLRNELLIIALLALVPIEILYLYPLAAQALLSLGQLYGP